MLYIIYIYDILQKYSVIVDMHIIVNFIINKIIRKNIYLYIFFIFIYKRFANLFLFIEKDSYSFIKNSRIYNIVDVGSNHFQIAKIILSLCKNKRIKIFSFDPITQDDFVTPKNVIFYNYALADKERWSYLYIPYYKHYKLDSLSSFYKKNINRYIKEYFPHLIKKIFFEFKKVQLKKLDDLNIKFQFIKIDTEGYELPIIKGAIKSIKKNNPIIYLEVNENFNKIEKILSRIGYQKYLYSNESKKFIRIKELKNNFNDVFFLNKDSLLL